MSSINRHGDGEGVTASVRLAVEDKHDYQQENYRAWRNPKKV